MRQLLTLLCFILITAAGCRKKENVNEILARDDARDSIMSNIAASQRWMAEMLSHIKKNKAASKMTVTDSGIIKRILKEDFPLYDTALNHLIVSKVFNMASKDTDVCDASCTEFMQNPFIQKRLKKMINSRKIRIVEDPFMQSQLKKMINNRKQSIDELRPESNM